MAKRTITAALTAIITLSVSGFSLAADKTDAALGIIPADSILCLRINHLDQAAGNLDQYLMGVSPMPVSTGGLLKGQLGIMFGNYDLKGFDVNGTFAAFVTAISGDEEPDWYILLPVTNYNDITDPNSRVSQPDTNGISAVGMGPSGQFFIKKVSSFAMMSNDYRKLSSMAAAVTDAKFASLQSSLDAAQAKLSAAEPIWAYANMVKISSVYKKDIAEGLDEVAKQMADPGMNLESRIDALEKSKQQIAANDPNNPAIARLDAQIDSLKIQKAQMQKSPAFMAGIANVFTSYARDFMQQSKSITITCNPKPSVLNFRFGIDAQPGTDMARTFVAEGTAKNNPLIGYTEDGSAMNIVSRINHNLFKKCCTLSVSLVAQMAGKDANDPNIVKTAKLLDDYASSIGDFVALSFKINPGSRPCFDAKYVLEVKDVNTFNKTNDEFIKMWTGSTFSDFYKSMGIETGFTVKRGAETYKGVAIDVAKLSMKSTDTNSPEAKMLEAMYGDGFEYRWAIVNNLWVCRISSDPNALNTLIDEVKAGPPAQVCSEMQKAMNALPDAADEDGILTYNYLRLFKMIQAVSSQMPFSLPDVPTRSNLVFGAKVSNGSIAVDFALTKEHLSEIMNAFQAMQQQIQQNMQKQQTERDMPQQQINQSQPAPAAPAGK